MEAEPQQFDVIVVGAGPAGATAAYYLVQESRRQGLPLTVALLEKARFPRDKYCGDAWCAPALDILEDMGVLQQIVADGLYQDTTSGGFVSPSGENYMTSEGGDAQVAKENRTFAIKRMICDERIARRAAETGAALIEEANVAGAELGADGLWRVRCVDQRELRCRMLIAADGATSKLARALGVVKDAPSAAAARQYVKGGTHNFKAGGVLLFPEYVLPGYVALFRHYNDDIDLGAYIIPGGAAKVEDAARIYEDKILNDPFIQRVLGPRVEFLEPVRTASLRMGGVERSTMKQFMAVGDAAGQTDPLTGEGIHTAMIGGRLAARRVLEMFAANTFDDGAAAVYHQRWMDAFGKDFKSSALSAKMSYRYPYFLDAAAKLAERAGDSFMNEFGAIMTGVKPKSTYARPDIAFPLTWEVSKQFFRQKILRQAAGDAAYRLRAEENPARRSSFSAVCLRDPQISAKSVQEAWAQKSRLNPAEELFQFANEAPGARPVLILYGSEYGFCKGAALRLAEELAEVTIEDVPLSPRVLDLAAHHLIDWSREPLVFVVCATAGDGEFPENAKSFVEWLEQAGDAALKQTAYALLACGDSSYPNFCRAGHNLHALLGKAGARAACRVHEVDQEDEDQLGAWFDAVHTILEKSPPLATQDAAGDYLLAAAQAHYAGQDSNAQISRKHPCRARIVARTLLTQADDAANDGQETVSLELDLRHFPDPRRMDWQPGDALGVLPHNSPVLVARILELMDLDGDTTVDLGPGGQDSLRFEDALLARLDIKPLNRARVEKFVAQIDDDEELAQWRKIVAAHGGDAAAAAREYSHGRELVDLLEDFPQTARQLGAEDWVKLLSPIQPRFYSIASSPLVEAEQITLCVSRVRFETHGKPREGLASNYLAAHLDIGAECDVFLQANQAFRPVALDAPVGCVMIGPGTGVSPFRGFVQHMAKQAEASGKTLARIWPDGDVPLLFFGCRHPERDFLYREEWQALDAAGEIRLITAFSRTQPEKIYVQQRLRDEAALIWQRLERGASFYVCGDATHMAGDVEQALLDIIMQQGRKTPEEARSYLDAVARAGRYLKDVWG
ncbi:Conditioned medium factor receptor 1 (modular protein) [Sterolibacterium denitrificans]|uniref:assimilatory sulfite reductase (NADPH) n=2 Tax=Sterolibacterium denitrificans TaxID=157592 RepID=A0A7Z7HP80_9PROT|nr:Conditioned medium factor receptor 1 (modular protein) [Sterolibacterium denitrificans]